jgi:hypothetical protein
MAYKYRTDYTLYEWHDLGSLVVLLNRMVNEGWRVENHKLSAGDDKSGWTIFVKTVEIDRPLLEREINVGIMYRILNDKIESGSDLSRQIDAEIKKAVRLPGDVRD